jgi:AraC-like DNA-binding protein
MHYLKEPVNGRCSKWAAKQQQIAEEIDRFRFRAERPEWSGLPASVREVLRYIHQRIFDSSLNVRDIRAGCGIRNHNISTQFRCVVGLGIREYIEALRLNMAQHLVQKKELEIYLVAMAVGYESQETFCRAFHRHFGCTATEYRSRRNVKTELQEDGSKALIGSPLILATACEADIDASRTSWPPWPEKEMGDEEVRDP